jgi:3-oxoacyl-[acyl-carrier-protein] synthase III
VNPRTRIESLGVYLPPREVTTREVIQGCRRSIRLPLERLSGISSRRVAGDGCYSIDLAAEAVTRCLATSSFTPEDVDLIIFTSVGRCDGPALWVSYEPATAMRLAARLGFGRAIAFDIASACAGMFTAIYVADAMLRTGAIRCALIASGEYISHLAETAQKEIDGMLDPRLACLTVGDAGAAVMLDRSPDETTGFDLLELCTASRFAGYCVAAPTELEHGGVIMHTDALRLTEAATRLGSIHALEAMHRAGWTPTDFAQLIMHQTSRTGLNGAVREINRRFRRPVCHAGNTIDNLAHRGNTASTTHFVALADHIHSGRIRNGDRLIFSISGSGLTVGTGLYRLDDLPSRMLAPGRRNGNSGPRATGGTKARVSAVEVVIRAVGLTARADEPGKDTLALLEDAGADCLNRWGGERDDVDLLIYSGVYRTACTGEPAIAALAAGRLDINVTLEEEATRRTLAFDVLNGSLGLLSAYQVVVELIRAGRSARAMVLAAEVENNRRTFPRELLGVEEAGSAVLLERASDGASGFGSFLIRTFPEHLQSFSSRAINRDRKTLLLYHREPGLEQRYLRCITATVAELIDRDGIELDRIARIFPPQISGSFISQLSAALGVPRDRLVDVSGDRDLYTSSLPFALRHAVETGLVGPGDTGLFIGAGAGIQVGCATYRF